MRFPRAGEQNIEIGDAAVGNPGLLAVQDVAIAITARMAFEGGGVGPRGGFRQSEGGDRRSSRNARQVALFLRIAADQRDRSGPKALHGESEIREARPVGQSLTNETNCSSIDGVR